MNKVWILSRCAQMAMCGCADDFVVAIFDSEEKAYEELKKKQDKVTRKDVVYDVEEWTIQ